MSKLIDKAISLVVLLGQPRLSRLLGPSIHNDTERKTMKKRSVILLVCIALVEGTAFAGTGSGKVTDLVVREFFGVTGPFFLFKTSARKAASCTDSDNWFAGRVHTAAGSAMFDLVMSALNEGHSVDVVGKGTCADVREGFEDVESIRLRLIPKP